MVDLLHEDNAMEDNEGFEVATGRKRRRIDSSNSSPAEKTYKKVFKDWHWEAERVPRSERGEFLAL